MFYQKKDLLEKAATMKRFTYLPLGNELKAQIDIAKHKQYKKLDNTNEFNRIKKRKTRIWEI